MSDTKQHVEDFPAMADQHLKFYDRMSDLAVELQYAAYATGRARGVQDAQAQIAELTRQRDALLEAATAIEFAMKLPGVTGNEVLADSSEIRIGLQAAIASAKGAA